MAMAKKTKPAAAHTETRSPIELWRLCRSVATMIDSVDPPSISTPRGGFLLEFKSAIRCDAFGTKCRRGRCGRQDCCCCSHNHAYMLLEEGAWGVEYEGLPTSAMDLALCQALARWIKENPERFRALAYAGLERTDGNLLSAKAPWATDMRLDSDDDTSGPDGIPECVERLGSIIETLKVAGGLYKGHPVSEYEAALNAIVEANRALAVLDRPARPTRRAAA